MPAASVAADLAEQLEPAQAELADELARFCLDRVPELPQDAEAMELLRAGARGHLALVTTLLTTPETELSAASQPHAAAAYAAMCARRGIDVGIVQRATRLGVDWFWRTLGERLAATVEDRAHRGELLDAGMEVVLGYADHAIGWIEPTYMEERRRWVRSPLAVRRDVVEEVLSGGGVDLDEASRRLGYELRGNHRALILWQAGSAATTDDSGAPSPDAADAVARLTGDRNALIVPGGGALWAWMDASAELDRWRGPAGWHAASGEPGLGLDGFRRSHAEAHVTYRALQQIGAAPALTRYPEVAVPALLLSEPERARDLVRAELGPLAGGGERESRLRATLAEYLAAGSRNAPAAQRLGVHENTVAYRLRQATELLGRPLDARRLELEVALRLLETLGAGWLEVEDPRPTDETLD